MGSNHKKNTKQTEFKRTLMEWGGIAAVFVTLYFTGLHTEVLGTMQRALLWTGLFDAEGQQVTTTNGPMLSKRDYQLQLVTPEGKQQTLKDFKGNLLFINVWASWCPPCVAEMPTIETLYKNVGSHDNIKFILLSMDKNSQKAVDFMESKEFPMPYYFPASGLPNEFRSQYLPTTYIISKEGQVIYKKEGIADYSSDSFKNWLIDQSSTP